MAAQGQAGLAGSWPGAMSAARNYRQTDRLAHQSKVFRGLGVRVAPASDVQHSARALGEAMRPGLRSRATVNTARHNRLG